jgi:hypothetical protein
LLTKKKSWEMSTRAERAARYALRREHSLAAELNAKQQQALAKAQTEPKAVSNDLPEDTESYGPPTYKEIFGESEPESEEEETSEIEIPPPSARPLSAAPRVTLVQPQPANISEALQMPPLEPVTF